MSIASSKPAANRSVLETVDNGSQDKGPLERQGDLDDKHLRVYADQAGEVDMSTLVAPLAEYLRAHEQWIEPCFKPLKVTSLSSETYQLKFFRMGALGFELEPCFGIQIGSKSDRLFFLYSIPLPGDDNLPYSVDCSSEFRLEERHEDGAAVTRVNWKLHLDIVVELPRFLQVLPRKRVRSVAEALVNQVARRMCNRLTQNICQDYYQWHRSTKAA
ncbi:MAG: DUF1997 domain-containing protein [Cyanobacteria bacterium P01_E01_bin.34]